MRCGAGQVRATNIEIFAGNRVSMRKPSPDIYNLAKGTVGVDAADCLVIEDDEVLARRMPAAWCAIDGQRVPGWHEAGGAWTCCSLARIVRGKAWNACWQVGLEAAKAAHMACLITTSAYTRGDDFKLADRIESSLQVCLPRTRCAASGRRGVRQLAHCRGPSCPQTLMPSCPQTPRLARAISCVPPRLLASPHVLSRLALQRTHA